MRARWYLWALGMFLVGLIALFPLRLALGMASGPHDLLSAKQVSGSIWSGQIGEATLGNEMIGTFDVAAHPLPALIGRISADFERLGGMDGPLSGTVHAGTGSQGVTGLNGRLDVSQLLAPLPAGAVSFGDATMLFDDGSCSEASGSVAVTAAMGLPDMNRTLEGTLSCADDGRAMASLSGPRGAERLTFTLDADGGYEADLVIEGAPPALRAMLAMAGFSEEGANVRLQQSGQLQ